jgi:hypothetical protein
LGDAQPAISGFARFFGTGFQCQIGIQKPSVFCNTRPSARAANAKPASHLGKGVVDDAFWGK